VTVSDASGACDSHDEMKQGQLGEPPYWRQGPPMTLPCTSWRETTPHVVRWSPARIESVALARENAIASHRSHVALHIEPEYRGPSCEHARKRIERGRRVTTRPHSYTNR